MAEPRRLSNVIRELEYQNEHQDIKKTRKRGSCKIQIYFQNWNSKNSDKFQNELSKISNTAHQQNVRAERLYLGSYVALFEVRDFLPSSASSSCIFCSYSSGPIRLSSSILDWLAPNWYESLLHAAMPYFLS